MRFTANRLELLAATEKVCSVVPKKSTLPITETIQLTVSANVVTLKATNLDTYCVSEVPLAENQVFRGTICVPGHRFLALLKGIPGTDVTVSNPAIPPKDDDPPDAPVRYSNKVTIESDTGRSQYCMTGEGSADFPPFPVMETHHELKLDDEIRESLSCALPFVSTDEFRPATQGVRLENDYKALTIVSTDGHRLYCRRLQERDWQPWECILPVEGLKIALKYCPLALGINDDYAIYRCEGIVVVSKLINEEYPNWQSVVPAASDMTGVTVYDRIEFLKLINRILPFASQTKQVRLRFEGSELTISAQDIDFGSEVKETMPSCFTRFDEADEPFEIGFNGVYLQHVFSTLKSELITMRVWTPTRAAILVTDKTDERMLLMPVRLSDQDQMQETPLDEVKSAGVEVMSDEKRKELLPEGIPEPRICPNCEKEIHDNNVEECWNCHTVVGQRPVDSDQDESGNDEMFAELCPNCGKPVEDSDSVCPHCHEELYACADCGHLMLDSWTKCPACGAEYEAV